MAKVFIIGNGFDSAHKMKTTYQDFRNYLLKEHSSITMDELFIPEALTMPDGEEVYDDEEVISLLFYLINEAEEDEGEWNKIEDSLGKLNYSHAFDYLDDILDRDGDVNPWKTSARNEDIATNLIIPITSVQRFFSEWVNSINLEDVNPIKDFEQLVEPFDKFLTFNYTETLEEVYGIPESNICHIHGKQHEELYFGHGNNEDYYENYMQHNIGSESGLSNIDRQLKKRTDEALRLNEGFFQYLEKIVIDAIYSHGFSFSSVDLVYISEICNRLNTKNITFYLDDYDLRTIGEKMLIIRKCGFEGDFNLFGLS